MMLADIVGKTPLAKLSRISVVVVEEIICILFGGGTTGPQVENGFQLIKRVLAHQIPKILYAHDIFECQPHQVLPLLP